MKQAQLLNALAVEYRRIWEDNALEAVLGNLSTVTTNEQLQALLTSLQRQK